MTTMTASRKEFSARRFVPAETRGHDWSKFIAPTDPLESWKVEFADWLDGVEKFREFEQEHFFKTSSDPVVSRVHRGWLCNLIGFGEWLAVQLLQEHGEDSGMKEQLQFVDTFLTNLQSTADTWHATGHDQSENPLASLFAS